VAAEGPAALLEAVAPRTAAQAVLPAPAMEVGATQGVAR
jgi:hypothetical protein